MRLNGDDSCKWRRMTPDGDGLGFQEMFNQLIDAASCHDKVTKDNAPRPGRQVPNCHQQERFQGFQ